MTCYRFPMSFTSLPYLSRFRKPSTFPKPRRIVSASPSSGHSFGWDDVLLVAEDPHSDSADLSGYFQRVRSCNRGSEFKSEFVPFLVEEKVVGYIHPGFIDHLRDYRDVFTIAPGKDGYEPSRHVALHLSLRTPEERTEAVADVIKNLGGLIPGIRNEMYPVTSSFGMPIFFNLERAAAPYFGIKAYGVHMNGYVDLNGQKYLWIGKRSDTKPTYPGMLDHLVAGGLPHGIGCHDNLVKECKEEAGIPRDIADSAISVGAVSYMDIEGYRYKRDILFCYDLKLPSDFNPKNEDGEVGSFRLIPLTRVANIIKGTEFFKPNCSLVVIDFLFRHGYINPDDCGYLELLQSLRSWNCT